MDVLQFNLKIERLRKKMNKLLNKGMYLIRLKKEIA